MRRLLLVGLSVCACTQPPAPPPPPATWAPGQVLRLDRKPNARGLTELRGLVHVHSIYSHDACDGAPHAADGGYNQPCLADFRRGACQSGHDFFFLTDHGDSFASQEFPEVLLHDAAQGDTLVTRDGAPTANWLACPDAPSALILAGTETGAMPVGLEHHVGAPGARDYGTVDNPTLDGFHAAKALTLVAHTEQWTIEQLATLHLDGFEMFNLHRNAIQNGGVAADLVLNYVEKGRLDELPHPDLFLATFKLDDEDYQVRWGSVLALGAHRVTTMGSDCHQNTFPQLLKDGERIDSYRRMMSAFSNHLLVKARADGTWDDVDLKAALAAGRNFGVFEFLGAAEGFDVVALEAGTAKELGDTAALAKGVTVRATLPHVKNLDPSGAQPTLTLNLLRAREGGFDVVASTTEATLSFAVTQPGAYRVEVRMVPKHLLPWAGSKKASFAAERPWVMSSALYVESLSPTGDSELAAARGPLRDD